LTLYEFNKLNLQNKVKTTLNHAIYLDSYVSPDFQCNCYALDLFFIELVYSPKLNSISEVRSFKDGSHLDKYTEDLKGLF